SDPALGRAAPGLGPEPGEAQYFAPTARERADALVTPPAICLLITGILGILGCCLNAIGPLVSEPKQPGPETPEWMRQFLEVPPQIVWTMSAIFGCISLLIVLGAVQMLRRRMYGLAMTSSILAMINFECLCCLLGVPFGIWSLVVL